MPPSETSYTYMGIAIVFLQASVHGVCFYKPLVGLITFCKVRSAKGLLKYIEKRMRLYDITLGKVLSVFRTYEA